VKKVDLIVYNGTVITVNNNREIIKNGAVAVEKNKIVCVGKSDHILSAYMAGEYVNAREDIVMPGLVDVHVHHVQTLARALADEIDLIPWCFDVMYPFETIQTEEDAYYSTLLSCMEMISTGTTCVADPGGYRNDAVAKGFIDAGMRGMVSWAGMDLSPATRVLPDGFPGKLDLEETLLKEEEVVKKWHNACDGLIRGSYALRIESNVSEDLYFELNRMAKRDGVIVHMHVVVNEEQANYVRSKSGMSTIELMDKLGILGPHWLLSHVSIVSDHDVDLLVERDVRLSHNPAASMKGAYGAIVKGKFPEMIKHGVVVGLGCDSTVVNNSLDLWRTMYQVAVVHHEVRLSPDLISPEKALEMATIDGAKALNWDREIGSLEAGKKADFIIVDRHCANFCPVHDFSLIANLVYSAGGNNVKRTYIDGSLIYDNGRFLTINAPAVLKEAQCRAEKIVQKHPYRPVWRSKWPVI